MYNGQKKVVPQFITGVKGGLVEGDVVSIEVSMTINLEDSDEPLCGETVGGGQGSRHVGRAEAQIPNSQEVVSLNP